ncbi:uncharacterized protein LOC130284370 [Hyla sarda]|uniref:uncharacterized protein LOC130284370 n=1 Tax=Hyla sarda TaxID=327740 RepID=UPI0024C394FF|nr:uncharacterized protein LOC130284370 [Hyla sarda]XP_056390629.1 uncharacterized protein LOC130284370 [Hyla sarda]
MVVCIVKGCTPKSREGKGEVILHIFPKDKAKIREWLTATGESFENVEELVNKIHEGRKNHSHRICSLHFPTYCYFFNHKTGKKRLTYNAVPSIFPTNPGAGEHSTQPATRGLGKRRRVDPEDFIPDDLPVGSTCPTCQQIIGSSHEIVSETSEQMLVKDKVDKFTIYDPFMGTKSEHAQTTVRTFSVRTQCSKLKPPKPAKLKKRNIFEPHVHQTTTPNKKTAAHQEPQSTHIQPVTNLPIHTN